MRNSLTAVLLLLAPILAAASGISVDPSYIKFSEVDLKGVVRLEKKAGYLLKLNNTGKTDTTYIISLQSCKESGIKPNGGYAEVPDLNWFVFKSTEVVVPGNSTGCLRYLEVSAPSGGNYENKRWQVVLKIAKRVSGQVGMDVQIPVWIETKVAKKSGKTIGDGK